MIWGLLALADGWNKDYGGLARARLTRAWWSGSEFRAALIEDSPGQYTLWDLLAADLDGDGQAEIVTRGSAEVRLLRRGDEGWSARVAASTCHALVHVVLEPSAGGDRIFAICADGVERLRP